MAHELWHLAGSPLWGHCSHWALSVWSRSRIKFLPLSPFSQPLPLLPFLCRATIQSPSFTQERTLTVNHLLNWGEASCAVFQVCFPEWSSPVKAGLEAESTVSWISLKTALFYFFFLLLKLFSPPKLIKSAFVFLNHSIDSSNSVQLNKAAANKPEWHLGPCTACHPFHQCFPFLFGGYYLSVLFVWQFFLGFANIYIVWFL